MSIDANTDHEEIKQPGPESSAIERFLDSFLQESNIKWMLLIGASIIAASSLMLVTNQWSNWSVTLKYLTMLSYTAATYGIAEYCGRRLGLQATSQVLKLLTLILIPISFLSLSWLTADADSIGIANASLTLLLMIPATGLMVFASDQIFTHWLQGRQHTFLASYMLLCLAGAMPVIDQTWLAVLFSCGFWLVMTLGVMKVNRHIFWLTEEHRWPRVFGFIPIAILSSQLVVLFATKTFGAIPLHWLGLGIVMLAGTILMTTRTIANVFRQRTGNLMRPLPWSIIVPLFTGLMLTATGVLISFHGFQFIGETTRAIVPTAIVAAFLLMMVASDTRHQSFVWAGLILIAIAYQSSPTLFSDLVQSFKATAASTLNEERLPVAFYGLTYMPMLLVLVFASRWLNDRKRFEFSTPMKQFVSVLSMLLIALALTNLKAAFVVSAASIPAFVIYAILFRDRSYVVPAILLMMGVAVTCVPFGNAVQLFNYDISWSFVVVASLGLVLSATPIFDRLALRIPLTEQTSFNLMVTSTGNVIPWFQYLGRSTAVLTSVFWIITKCIDGIVEPNDAFQLSDSVTLGISLATLAIWTLRSTSYAVSYLLWIIAIASAWSQVSQLSQLSMSSASLIAMATVVSGMIGITITGILRSLGVDISMRRFALANQTPEGVNAKTWWAVLMLPLGDLAMMHFAAFVSIYYVPAFLGATISLMTYVLPEGWAYVIGLIAVTAVIFRGPLAMASAAVMAPILAGIVIGHLVPTYFTHANLTVIYALTSLVMTIVVGHQTESNPTARRVCSMWQYGLVTLAFLFISPTVITGGAIALVAIYGAGKGRFTATQRTRIAILGSSLAILALATLSGYRGQTILLVVSRYSNAAYCLMLLGLVMAIVTFDRPWKSLDGAVTRRFSLLLRAFGSALCVVCHGSANLEAWHEAVVVSALLLAAINEIYTAIESQYEPHAWAGFALVGFLALWVRWHHAISFAPLAMRIFLVVITTLAVLLSKRWHQHPTLHIMVRSLHLFGMTTPFVAAAWSLTESNHNAFETLVVLGAAMIMFVHGRAVQKRRFVVAAGVTANLGLSALWSSYSLTDPQLYLVPVGLTMIGLVELMRGEIPTKAHDPLRHIGALIILVSPCVEILGGSWLHIITLMLLSVLVVLLAIGFRVKALMYTGTAFLMIDLAAMVIRSSIDHPGMLWVAGLAIGASVIGIAAVCERNREQFLSRIRVLSAQLSTWQ